MPKTYIEPEVAFQVTDQTGGTWIIYHTYRNDDFDQGRSTFWYTTDASEDEEFEFDIRSLFFTPCHLDKELTPMQRAADNADQLVLQIALGRGIVAFNDIGEFVFTDTTLAQRA